MEDDYANSSSASMKIRLKGAEADSRSPGPYVTNRHHQTLGSPGPDRCVHLEVRHVLRLADPVGFGQLPRKYALTSVLLSVAAETGVTPRVAIHADNNGRPGGESGGWRHADRAGKRLSRRSPRPTGPSSPPAHP